MSDLYSFIYALTIFSVALACSFFFSGTEIGFYRMSRAKAVLDALDGCRRASFLFWLANHPSIFIATALLGNNLANNFVSFGSVLLVQILFPDSSVALISTLVVTPIVFIYGELLPKSIFLMAPTRLMKLCAPVLKFIVYLFMPVSVFLVGLNMLIARLVGEKNRQYLLQMTDTELNYVFGEGRNAGIWRPTQQSMAEKIFQCQACSLDKLTVSIDYFPLVRESASRDEALQAARKTGRSWILTQRAPDASQKNRPDGFCFFSDLLLASPDQPLPLRKLLELPVSASFSEAMKQMFTEDAPFAALKNANGKIVGILERPDSGENLWSSEMFRFSN